MPDGLEFQGLSQRMESMVNAFKHDLASLKTGRASSSFLDPIHVDAYGTSMPLNQVATISVPEARMLSVSVWDQKLVQAADKAIRESNLGLNPIVEGTTLRIPLPEPTEERRKQLVKVAHQYAEHARVGARHIRRDGMENLKKVEKDGEITQDEMRSQSGRVQKMTDETIAMIDKLLGEKEAEIMQV